MAKVQYSFEIPKPGSDPQGYEVLSKVNIQKSPDLLKISESVNRAMFLKFITHTNSLNTC